MNSGVQGCPPGLQQHANGKMPLSMRWLGGNGMSEIDGTGGGDIHISQEIAGLKELVNAGDVSSLTLLRMIVLVENALDRIWQLEQQQLAAAHTPHERSGP
jgi:hypothetical protein